MVAPSVLQLDSMIRTDKGRKTQHFIGIVKVRPHENIIVVS